MTSRTTEINLNERIEWTGRHDLLDDADDKVRLEAAILRHGSGACRFRIDVLDAKSPRDGRAVRPTLCVYLKNGDHVHEWLTLEGGDRNGWIPRFAEHYSLATEVIAPPPEHPASP